MIAQMTKKKTLTEFGSTAISQDATKEKHKNSNTSSDREGDLKLSKGSSNRTSDKEAFNESFDRIFRQGGVMQFRHLPNPEFKCSGFSLKTGKIGIVDNEYPELWRKYGLEMRGGYLSAVRTSKRLDEAQQEWDDACKAHWMVVGYLEDHPGARKKWFTKVRDCGRELMYFDVLKLAEEEKEE